MPLNEQKYVNSWSPFRYWYPTQIRIYRQWSRPKVDKGDDCHLYENLFAKNSDWLFQKYSSFFYIRGLVVPWLAKKKPTIICSEVGLAVDVGEKNFRYWKYKISANIP